MSKADIREWLPTDPVGSCNRLYWDSASEFLFVVRSSGGGRFIYEAINPAFEAALGLSSPDVEQLDVFDCVGREDAGLICEALRACLAEGAEVRVRHNLALGGSRRETETTAIPIVDLVDGAIVRLVGSHRILHRKPFETLIGDKAGVLSNVSIASIQEDIQQRIASELHDSTCQYLIAASLGLMRIRAHLGVSIEATRLCNEIDASIDEALKEIRAFTYLLYPQDLTTDGLKATIEHYARNFSARTSLYVSTSIPAIVDQLPYEHQRSLLRVTQEALTNVFRHAKATEVKIAIEATDAHLRLTISDNGCGFDAAVKLGPRALATGVGIPAMRARLEQLGGTLEIHSNPALHGFGTRICAAFVNDLTTKVRKRRTTAVAVRARAHAR